MSKPYLLAIGTFYDWDAEELTKAFEIVPLAPDMDPSDLPGDIRAQTRFAARIGHRDVAHALFDAFPALEIVSNFGVGYDGVDVDEAARRGIAVTNTPDVLTDDVADQAVLMLLAFLRDSHGAEAYMRAGKWSKANYPLKRSLGAGRAGIIGLGRIGTAIAHRLAVFGCDISYFARSKKPVPETWIYHDNLPELAREVDYLINVLPGGPVTEDLIDAKVLSALGTEGVFVNIGRGSSVDEDALLDALNHQKIAGAALDVFKNEPDIDPRFYDADNLLLQPHAASATIETRKAMGKLMRANLTAALESRPLLSRVN